MPTVTLSISVDVSDSLEEARTRLLRTARALNRAWVAALCSMVLLALASLASAGGRDAACSRSTSSSGRCCWRRPATTSPGTGLIGPYGAACCSTRARWPHCGRWSTRSDLVAWPDVVRLVPEAELELADGELVLGMPLLACLDQGELCELMQRRGGPGARRAGTRGSLGGPGRPRRHRSQPGRRRRPRLTWPSARLTVVAARPERRPWRPTSGTGPGRALAPRRVLSDADAAAQTSRDQVGGGMDRAGVGVAGPGVRSRPAARRSVHRAAPLHRGCGRRRVAGSANSRGGRRPGCSAIWSPATRRRWLAISTPRRPAPPDHVGEHPTEVTVPQWRALVAEVLDASRTVHPRTGGHSGVGAGSARGRRGTLAGRGHGRRPRARPVAIRRTPRGRRSSPRAC